MSELFIIVVIAIWIFGAVSSIRKAIARSQAQAQAGGPLAAQASQYPSGIRPTPAQRAQAMQSAIRVLRAASSQPAAQPAPVPATAQPAPRYIAPAADAPMSMLTNMVAPNMPAFDAMTLDAGVSTSPAYNSANPAALNIAQIMGLPNGQNFATLSIVAAAVIGPPVGLRAGASLAADW
ncbi:MAG TPA: hypothetical protein VKT51_04260 [Candidatus Eremiobacteraceae bacterium]|nr:hypothetical protein [Candidatus Eremiobacteraceae bacterium]